jgi:ubiquinone/menaquinone biosynthesis C-methylase UbiE
MSAVVPGEASVICTKRWGRPGAFTADISPGMLRKAQKSCDANGWDNVELCNAMRLRSRR